MRDGSRTLIVPGHSEPAVRWSGLESARSGPPESLLHLFSSRTPFHPAILSEDPSSGTPRHQQRARTGVRGRSYGRRCACAKAGALRMRKDGRLGNLRVSAVTLVPLRAYPDPLRAWAHRWASGTAALRGWSRSAPWVERTARAALKGPGTRAPSLRGRREGAWGARGAGQHESAADGAETAQPAGGPGTGNRAPPLPGPHQRGEPTGERGPGPRGVACCGTLSLRPALCTVSLGAPGLFLQLPILEPSFAF